MRSSGLNFFRFALVYSFRSLGRNPRRATLTILTVVFASAVTILANRYASAVMSLWAEGACDTGLAHLQVVRNGYREKQEGIQKDLLLRQNAPFEKLLEERPEFVAGARRLRFEGIISSGKKTVYFVGVGVEPTAEAKVSNRLFGPSDQGSFVADDDPKGVVLGRGLAQSLKVGIGSSITLMAPTSLGTVDARDFKVRGIVNVPIPSFSQRIIYVPIQEVQKLVKLPDLYSEYAVKLVDSHAAATVQAAVAGKASTESLQLQTWYEVEPTIRSIEKIFHAVIGVISALLFVSASLSVLNIIMILVAERTVEIGTLMAIGSRTKDIERLFSLEAALIGGIGGLIGLVVANLAVKIMNIIGMPFKSPFGTNVLNLHPEIHWGVNTLVLFVSIGVCLLAAIGPARRAAGLEPVKAFRGQLD